MHRDPQVQLLLTGNEIMSGDTVDSNSALIAQRLADIGLGIYRKVTVGDDRALLGLVWAAQYPAGCRQPQAGTAAGGVPHRGQRHWQRRGL